MHGTSETLVKSSAYRVISAVTRAAGPREMRSPDTAHSAVISAASGEADAWEEAARAALVPLSDVSAALMGAPWPRVTASAAVATIAKAVPTRQPRLAPARIVAPLRRSPRMYPS